MVVEKRKIGKGSTSANAGLLQYINDRSLTAAIHRFGEDKAVRHYSLFQKAVQIVREEIIPKIGTGLDYCTRNSLYFASTKADEDFLIKEYQTLKQYKFPVEFYTREMIQKAFSFSKPAALVSKSEAEINPLKYTHALFKFAAEAGVKVYEETEIIGKTRSSEDYHVVTSNGHTIRAKYLVYSIGYEASHQISVTNAFLTTSYCIVTNPLNIKNWKDRMLIWETARPYLYVRTTQDNRIIAGGLDEDTDLKDCLS